MDTIKEAFKNILTMNGDEAKHELEVLIRLDRSHPIQFLVHPPKTDIKIIEDNLDIILQTYVVEKLGRGMVKDEMDYLKEHSAAFSAILISNICLGSILLDRMASKRNAKIPKQKGDNEDNG